MARTLLAGPDLDRLEVAVAVELYDILSRSTNSSVAVPELLSRVEEKYQSGLLTSFIYIVLTRTRFFVNNRSSYALTTDGLIHIANGIGDHDSLVYEYLKGGWTWVFGQVNSYTSELESDTDEWKPLAVDRESDDFQAMIQASEAALSQIESSNGYAVTDPEERNGLVEAIRGGLTALKNGSVSRGFVRSALISPFIFVARKFLDSIVGQISQAAADALKKWLFG